MLSASLTQPHASCRPLAALLACIGVAVAGLLHAQNIKPLTPDVQKIVDQLKARGVKIQGEVALTINGQTVILNQSGVQAPGATAAQVAGEATLRWRNGEKLAGELAGVKDGTLLWRSPLFAEPLALDMAALEDADFPPATRLSDEPFVVKLRDGGRLFGTPVSLDADRLSLRSARHGEISLRLAEVVSLQRTHGAGLLYHGPDTAAGWRLPSGSSGKLEWRTQDGGNFGTMAWNRSARLDLDLPSKVDVLLRVSASASPTEFTFTLSGSVGPPLTVEYWSGTVVLAQGNRFVPLKNLNDGTSFSVRLLWDRAEGRAFAFTPEGELLGELKPAVAKEAAVASQSTRATASSFNGVQIRNNGLDLTLDELRVREWKGEMPERIKPTEAGVELTNGKTLQGKVTALSGGRITVGSGVEVPLEDLEALITGATPTAANGPSPAAILAFEDGTRLVGSLQSVNDGVASMQIAASAVAISAPTSGLQRIHLDVPATAGSPPEPPFAKQDKVVLGKVTLHGHVTGAGDAEPRWLPVGGRTPVALATASQPVFSRAFIPDAVPQPAALVYLENGDVLPGEVRAMDATSLHIASPLSEVQELPAAQVQAVQFGGRKLELKGFGDPGWRQVRGAASSLQHDNSKVLFRQPASFAHPNILQGDEVKFVLTAEDGWGALRVRVFTSGGDEPEGGFALLLYLSGNELYGGLESDRGGDFANQVQIRTAPNQPVNIRLALQEKQVELFANGVSICKASATPNPKDANAAAQQRILVMGRGRGQPARTKILGPGLVFETVSIWGNGEQPVGVRDFSVRPNPMRPWMPAIDPKAKEQTLTLPRFRVDDPPTHVLVALNGDVLRGRLEAATAEHLRVTSGLESLTIPRDRVAAVIRLQPPDKPAPSPSPAPLSPPSSTDTPPPPPPPSADATKPATTHWILLTDGGRFGLNVERFDADKIIGHSTLLGRCEVPWDRVSTVRYTAPEPTTAQASYREWKLKAAPEPVLPEGGSQSSPLLGKEVKDFKVPLLAGGEFDFAKQRGKIVILDFWATWCGPCIQSLPELMETVESLKADKDVADKLVFVAMNQAEGAPQIKRFLEQRGWKLPVGLDLLQTVGRQFQVEGIPHTVLVGPDGKIAWTNTGARPGAAQELAEMVKKLAK
jgi:thiol-disulfide isomerase/thioredoxin